VQRKLSALAALLAVYAAPAAAENPAEVMELGKIDVVATTPLPGLGTPLARVPANVQLFGAADLAKQRPSSLPDFLDSNAASVSLNSGQGNPFQPDLSYRGFTASPLLGLSQGLSVFQDGVRVNEPFGDVVNWDLIPKSAIASVQLLPGSSPAFGPNTLGGALSIYTKSGDQFPGGSLDAYGGSFGRRALEIEQGGSRGEWDYFVTAHALRDDGWAAHNPSRLNQLFAKVGYQTDATDLDLAFTAADNTLDGTQTIPLSFLGDIRQAYTYPDRTTNRLTFLTLKGSRFLAAGTLLGMTAYARRLRSGNFASNVNGDFGEPLASGGVDAVQATNDVSDIDQASHGIGVQLTLEGKPWQRDNRFEAGASGDWGDTRFTRNSQPAQFDASRGTVATGDFELVTDAQTRNAHYGVFATDSLALNEYWVATLSARYNIARISIEDRSGNDPGLAGSHRFARLNPALGVTFNPTPRLTTYAAYTESMRAPTPVELTCADPDAPCKLPNNFLSDPPLQLVTARTIEAGARGKLGDAGKWSAAVYRTALTNDIQFVSSVAGAANAGYFRNVGKTRRQGIELAAEQKAGPIEIEGRVSLIDATFQSPFLEASPNNSSSDASGAAQVLPGDRIPGIPQRTFKLRLEYDPGPWSAGATLVARSAIYARGDENNRDANGRVPGYTLLNLNARWNVMARTLLYASVDNVFDKRYANFGILGRNFFTGEGRTFDGANSAVEQFRGMGAPRGAWLGIRHEWR
jgi:iron complex outermembrane recepter protein